MNFLRNPEIKRLIAFSLVYTIIAAGAGLFVSPVCALFSVGILIPLICAFLYHTKKRYDAISELSELLDGILNGENVLSFEDFSEGELSVLQNEAEKLVTRLREQNDLLKAEKLRLCDELADISHQIKTPLTEMNLIVSLLQSPETSSERRSALLRQLLTLLSGTDRLVALLLKGARLDAGAVRLDEKTVSVRECVNKAYSVLDITFELKNISFTLDAENESFTGDIDWTAEALGNILKNCTEHTPPGGQITVTAEQTPIFTKIQICDTGCGFDEKDIPKLFERFYKGRSSKNNTYGIGLNLARSIITMQNGTIKAFNGENGACFEIRFYKSIV